MLDEVAQRLDQKIQTVMGLDCIEILTAAGTVMNSDWYSDIVATSRSAISDTCRTLAALSQPVSARPLPYLDAGIRCSRTEQITYRCQLLCHTSYFIRR